MPVRAMTLGELKRDRKPVRPSIADRDSATKRGYDRRWRKARMMHLVRNPLCVMCLARGETTQATVVDHIVPHKGDPVKFWDSDNWQSLCVTDHNSKTATEDGGFGNRA